MAGKTARIRFPGHSYESCKSPAQMERENEMIVISHRLFACSDRAATCFMGDWVFPLAYITYRTCGIHQISFLKYGIFLIPHVSTTPSA